MADNVAITAGDATGGTVALDEVSDGTLGTVKVQYVKLMSGTIDGTDKAAVGANGLEVDVQASALPTGAATETTLAAVDTKLGAALDVSGATVTISGTVTANLGAVDNAVLDAIAASVALLDNAISGTEMQVDVVTSALPTGAATETTLAAVDTKLGAALDVSGATVTISGTVTANLSATDNAVLDAIETNTGLTSVAAQLLDNAISGSEMQVDVVASLPAGTNNIGDVDIASAIPAGTNHIGAVGGVLETSEMRDAGSAVTPKFAAINVAGSGDNTLVAAVASKKIRVLALMAMAGGTVNVRLESGAGGTALTGVMELLAQTGFVLPYNPVGWCETAVNTLLNLELSAAINVDGVLTYVEVD